MEQSQAFQDGYFMGRILGAILMLLIVGGGGVFFIFALVKACTRKTTGWIVTAAIMGTAGLALGVLMVFGIAAGIAKTVNQSDLDQKLASKDGRFSISVPRAWKADAEPGEMACLGATSRFPARYVRVIAFDKKVVSKSLADYATFAATHLAEDLKNSVSSEPEAFVMGSYPAIRYRVSGSMGDKDHAVHHLTFVETPGALCQIACWSLKSDENLAMPVFDKIAASFVEKAE